MLRRVLIVFTVLALFGLVPAGASAGETCPNEDRRIGPSSNLSDCRAYELVTPSNTNGGSLGFDLANGGGSVDSFPTDLATEDGANFLFMTKSGSPLVEPSGANGFNDSYETVRDGEGWRTIQRITPSGAQVGLATLNTGGVSADHQYGIVAVGAAERPGREGTLSMPSTGSREASYLRSPDGSFGLVGVGSLGQERGAEVRWISPHGEHLIFSTGGEQFPRTETKQLEPDAAPTGTAAIYDRSALGGPTHVVSLLPGNVPFGVSEGAIYQGASVDGSVVAFRGGGGLYVRLDDTSTVRVPDAVLGGGPQTFAGLTSDGEYLFYVQGGEVFRFDTSTGAVQGVISVGGAEITTISADGSHVYFISHANIGGEGIPGQPNLYVWDQTSNQTTFIATVTAEDLTGQVALNNWTTKVINTEGNPVTKGPGDSAARTTPDGSVMVFESAAKLTAYENAGLREIYRYDTHDRSLLCVSCNSHREPAVFPAHFERLSNGYGMATQAVVLNLNDNGDRVFFETTEGLVSRDTDGNNDIYEWSGGSLSLISSGQSPLYANFGVSLPTNVIGGITPSGSDVFFFSFDALTPTAGVGGAPAIYDARVGGGFPELVVRSCEGEGCQPAGSTSLFGIPASSTFSGGGNPVQKGPSAPAKSKKVRKKVVLRCKRGRTGKKTGKRGACRRAPKRQRAGHGAERTTRSTKMGAVK